MPAQLTELNKKEFEKLCKFQCTKVEICEWFGITDKTLDVWCKRIYKKGFSDIFKQKRAGGKISLRRSGFQMAKEVPSVWIFHAKNFLGMTDKPEETGENKTVNEIANAIKSLRNE